MLQLWVFSLVMQNPLELHGIFGRSQDWGTCLKKFLLQAGLRWHKVDVTFWSHFMKALPFLFSEDSPETFTTHTHITLCETCRHAQKTAAREMPFEPTWLHLHCTFTSFKYADSQTSRNTTPHFTPPHNTSCDLPLGKVGLSTFGSLVEGLGDFAEHVAQ